MHTPLAINNLRHCQPHPWHPSVVYCPEPWNGHRWWMAQTPFPPFQIAPYRDRYELPCIHYSDDGIHWNPIPCNPIDDIDIAMVEAHNYLSDPHLLIRGGTMECYYRLSLLKDHQLVDNKTILMRKTSIDGFHWGIREIIADLQTSNDVAIWGEQIISPAFIWNGNCYRCWYVDRSSYLSTRRILMTTSEDGSTWNTYTECHLTGTPDIDPWHLDVQFYNNEYHMLLYDGWSLHWLSSSDGVDFRYIHHVLSPTQFFTDFYSDGLYRACSVKMEDCAWIYFSAKTDRQTSIGLMTTKDYCQFTPVNGISQWKYLCTFVLPRLSVKNCKRLAKRCLRQIGLMPSV